MACAQDLGLVDLVLLVDAAAYAGDIDLSELRVALRNSLRGRRGVAPLRRALDLADDRSESPWETLLRLLHVVCGIEVEPQYALADDNGSVARADLWLVRGRAASTSTTARCTCRARRSSATCAGCVASLAPSGCAGDTRPTTC